MKRTWLYIVAFSSMVHAQNPDGSDQPAASAIPGGTSSKLKATGASSQSSKPSARAATEQRANYLYLNNKIYNFFQRLIDHATNREGRRTRYDHLSILDPEKTLVIEQLMTSPYFDPNYRPKETDASLSEIIIRSNDVQAIQAMIEKPQFSKAIIDNYPDGSLLRLIMKSAVIPEHAKLQLCKLYPKKDDLLLHVGDKASTQFIRDLIGIGARVDAHHITQKTPLHRAVESENLETAAALIALGADVNAKTSFNQTSLHSATQLGNVAMMKLLIKHGADVTVADNRGNTPLHYAILEQNKAAIQALHAAGADMNAHNNDGATPMHMAVQLSAKLKMIEFLHQLGADLDARDKYDRTPLMYAILQKKDAIVKLLISLGADARAVDILGDDALSYIDSAFDHRDKAMMRALHARNDE